MNIKEIIQKMAERTKTYVDNKVSAVKATPFDWNATDTTSKSYIKNKPTSLPANGGNVDSFNGYKIWTGTKEEYEAISSKESDKLYFIKESNNNDNIESEVGGVVILKDRKMYNEDFHGGVYWPTDGSSGIYEYSASRGIYMGNTVAYYDYRGFTFANKIDFSKYTSIKITYYDSLGNNIRMKLFTSSTPFNGYYEGGKANSGYTVTSTGAASESSPITKEFDISSWTGSHYFALEGYGGSQTYITDLELVAADTSNKVLLNNTVNTLGSFRVLYEHTSGNGTNGIGPTYHGAAFMEGSKLVTRFGIGNNSSGTFEGYECSLATQNAINVSGYTKLQFTIADGDYTTTTENAYLQVGLGSNPSTDNYYPTVFKTLTGKPGATKGTYTVDISSFTRSNSTAYLMFYFNYGSTRGAANNNRYWFSEIKLIRDSIGGGTTTGKYQLKTGYWNGGNSTLNPDSSYLTTDKIPYIANNYTLTYNYTTSSADSIIVNVWGANDKIISTKTLYVATNRNQSFSLHSSDIASMADISSVKYITITLCLTDNTSNSINSLTIS